MKILLAISLFFLFSAVALGQEKDLFAESTPLKFKLNLDMAALQESRQVEDQYLPAELSYQNGDGDKIQLPLRVKVGGNFRRDSRNCEWPPLRLRFEKEDRQGTLFDEHKKLKLVTSCQGESFVLREYSIYLVWNLLSDYGFKVRLGKMDLYDQQSGKRAGRMMVFFIEDDEEVADRIDGEVVDYEEIRGPIDDQIQARLHLFEYMIGNTDWDYQLGKNLEFIHLPASEKTLVLPYDFDWSAIVAAPYTGLADDYDHRRFVPPCVSEEVLQSEMVNFLTKREVILDIFSGNRWLKDNFEAETRAYLNEFFEELGNPQKRSQIFTTKCD